MASTPIHFKFEGAASAPRRVPSGQRIKMGVIQAMSEQQKHFARAHELADQLMGLVRKTTSSPPPGGGGRQH